MRPTARGRRWGHRSASSGDDRPIHRNGAGRGLASGGGLSAPTTPGASGRREPKGQLRTGKAVTAPSPCCELRRRKEAEQRPRPGAAFAPRPSANAAAGWSFRAAGRGLRRGEGGGRSPGPPAPGAEQVPAESVPSRGGARVARIQPLASLPGRAQAGASLCTYPARHPQGLPGVALMSFAPGPPRGPSVCSAGTRPPGSRSRLLRAHRASSPSLLAAFPPPRFPRRTCCFFGEMF